MSFDTLIKNGEIIDGTGRLRYKADIGIVEGKIAAMGHLVEAKAARTVDATNLIVAPGFIDMHSHSDMSLFDDPGGERGARRRTRSSSTVAPDSLAISSTPRSQWSVPLSRAVRRRHSPRPASAMSAYFLPPFYRRDSASRKIFNT